MYCYILLFSLISLQCRKNIESSTNNTGGLYNHNRNPGNSARDFLSGTPFKSLKIELQYMPGFRPDPRVATVFVDLLNEKLNKPGGIIVIEKEIDPTLKTVLSLSDISAIELRNRTVFTSGDQMGVYMLFTSGTYSESGTILGLAYKNTSICFFGEPLEYFTSGGTQEDDIRIIALLLLHEFGHLLGLVDMGSPMIVQHRDAANGNHCDNNKCLMHHTFEGNKREYRPLFLENPSFDANCSHDLKANGGK